MSCRGRLAIVEDRAIVGNLERSDAGLAYTCTRRLGRGRSSAGPHEGLDLPNNLLLLPGPLTLTLHGLRLLGLYEGLDRPDTGWLLEEA